MRIRPASRAVIAGASLVATWATAGRPAQAQVLVSSTLVPTSSVVSTTSYLPTSSMFPTSTILPTSTYFPTSYLVPTSAYYPTSSIIETGSSVYLPTTSYVSTYRSGRVFRPRRYVERTSYNVAPFTSLTPTSYIAPTSYLTTSALLPTSYVIPTMATSTYLPTTYLSRSVISPTSYLVDDGLIATSATSAVCCDPAPAAVAPAPATSTRAVAPRPVSPSAASGAPIISQPGERTPSATVSPTLGGEGMSSDVTPPVITPAPLPPVRPKAAEPVVIPTPEPATERPNDPLFPEAGKTGSGGQNPQTDDKVNSTSFKPSNYPTRSGGRNILRGRVVAFDSGRAEEFVPIVLTNLAGGFLDRTLKTDADGEFKVSLPDGDWAVKVTMPSGSVFTVGRAVTASGGRVVDPNGQPVGELIITR